SGLRDYLLQNFEPLAHWLRIRDPGDVRPGPSKRGRHAGNHRIRAHADDGDRPGGVHGGAGRGRIAGEDDVNRQAGELPGEPRESLVIAGLAPFVFDVLAVAPAELAELGHEPVGRPMPKDADRRHRRWSLRWAASAPRTRASAAKSARRLPTDQR